MAKATSIMLSDVLYSLFIFLDEAYLHTYPFTRSAFSLIFFSLSELCYTRIL